LNLVRVRIRAASGISSEWLRISDKPGKIALIFKGIPN